LTMSVTQQEPVTLPAIERQVAQIEDARAAAMADYAHVLHRADTEGMAAARRKVEELTRRRAALLAPRIHARLAAASRSSSAAAAHLADVTQSALASQQDALDARSLLASLNSLDSSGRRDAVQRLAGYEATAAAAEEEVVGARRRYAAAHAWAADLAREVRRQEAATDSIMTGGAIAARAAVVDAAERRQAGSLRSAAQLVEVAQAHTAATFDGLRLAERFTLAARDKLREEERLIARTNVLEPERHRREAALPLVRTVIADAEQDETMAVRSHTASSRQLADALADQAALLQHACGLLPLWVATVDRALDDGTPLETALAAADHATG